MAELTSFQAIPIKDLLGDLSIYRYNPSMIQRRILDHLEDVTSGQIDIVDPTNPFIFLLEASTVNTTLAIQENHASLRKSYARLAQDTSDVYMHMSDQDYLDRFAVPSTADFTVYIELNSLLKAFIDVPAEGYYKLSIPRNTEVTIDGMVFSLQYPISIYRHYSGVFQVKYDTDIESPLQSLTTNIIDYKILKDAQSVSWVTFKIPLTQFKVVSVEYPIQLSKPFVEEIAFDDSFYTARVFYKPASTDTWIEILTTHTDQVFDPYKPTALLKVLEGFLRVFIPPVYLINGLVSGVVRVDVYNTRGKIDVNFSNYPIADFKTELRALDPKRDLNTFTNAFAQTSFFTITDQFVADGNNASTFIDLRSAVIENSLGDRSLPITPTQLSYDRQRHGFDIHKEIDVITDRAFIAAKDLPYSSNRYPVTPISVTTMTYINTLEQLRMNEFVKVHNKRLTIPSSTVFEFIGSQVRLLSKHDLDYINALPITNYLSEINQRVLLATPFHYVLDLTSDEYDLRAYCLDYPKASELSFVDQNASLDFVVNTATYSIKKTELGYTLRITTKSGNLYKEKDNNNVGVQLMYTIPGERIKAYLNGNYVGRTEDGERIFEFRILTGFDVNNQDELQLTNFRVAGSNQITLSALLDTSFTILHYTKVVPGSYRAIQADQYLGDFLLYNTGFVSTEETLSIHFGDALSNLWRHYRAGSKSGEYATYAEDVPMFYDQDIYEVDPDTGLIFTMGDDCTFETNLLHRKHDIVRNANDEIVYKYRKGDVKLDSQGQPILISDDQVAHYLDLVLMDYKSFIANRTDFKQYLSDTIQSIVQWVVRDMGNIDKELLEITRIFFMPKRNIGQTLVMVSDGVYDYINLLQSIKIQYYVNNAIFNDMTIRSSINYRTTQILSAALAQSRISTSDITELLKTEFGDAIDTIYIHGLGGDKDLKVCYIKQDNTTLALNKMLKRQANGEMILEEDVEIEYIDIEQG